LILVVAAVIALTAALTISPAGQFYAAVAASKWDTVVRWLHGLL
jgi:hypothetical protein